MKKVIKEFIEMMEREFGISEKYDNHMWWNVLSKLMEYPQYQALKDLAAIGRVEEAYCLKVELDQLVSMIFKAKDLERLQETTRLNFPEDKTTTCPDCNYKACRCKWSNEPDGWNKWEGGEDGECPDVGDDVVVEIKQSSGQTEVCLARMVVWSNTDIIAYRIVGEPKKEEKQTLLQWLRHNGENISQYSPEDLASAISEYLERENN